MKPAAIMSTRAHLRGLPPAFMCWALVLAMTASMTPALALNSDRDAPIEVSAERKETDLRAGVSVYSGGVEIRQGSLLATANRAEVSVREGTLERIVLEGAPARFQLQTERQGPVEGRARRIEYQAEAQRLQLLGDGTVQRATDTLSAERITYDLIQDLISADAPEGNGRVRVILQPPAATRTEAPPPSGRP